MLSGFELYPPWVPLSCPCYYSQIEGLRLHVVYITRYVIRIKKHLHNRIEIIEIESNRKEYRSLHPYFLDENQRYMGSKM